MPVFRSLSREGTRDSLKRKKNHIIKINRPIDNVCECVAVAGTKTKINAFENTVSITTRHRTNRFPDDRNDRAQCAICNYCRLSFHNVSSARRVRVWHVTRLVVASDAYNRFLRRKPSGFQLRIAFVALADFSFLSSPHGTRHFFPVR